MVARNRNQGQNWTNQQNSGGSPSFDSDETDWRTTAKKALKMGSDWPDKDELLDVLYWSRQLLALIVGTVWGIIPFHGLLAIILYVAITTIIGHLYVTGYQNTDEELIGGFWEVAKEGFGAAFATFMVSWIALYSALHFF